MQLNQLLEDVSVIQHTGNLSTTIREVHFDSRRLAEGDLFVAVPGTQVDGHTFIDIAIEKGVHAIVCEQLPENPQPQISWVVVSRSQEALSKVMANFFGRPAEQLAIVGVTGTNGKTSVATLLHQLFQQLGQTAGLVSTVQYMVGNEVFLSSHTTPDARQLQELFAHMVEAGCEFCFMEVSSHALSQGRVAGVPFQAAAFTNLTHDHLDYHGTFANYRDAKKLLFDNLGKQATALINLDDKNGRFMVQNTRANVRTYALNRMADYQGRIIENGLSGLQMEINGHEVWFRLVGSFNAYNLLAVLGIAVELGFEEEEVLAGMSLLEGASGRFQRLQSPNGLTAIVDYAHTPDALENVLSTLQDVNQAEGKILTVVGCGGNRDKGKRPSMAKIATRFSDKVVLTSDNPRDEDPASILEEMKAGIDPDDLYKVLVIQDRREAIRVACQLADSQDLVLVAGKGHETYQEIRGVRHPFDDREVLRKAFEDLAR
ncbi:MAG: UDP-N-acetylmuramoyl-L-alanyl-D-glutamate--2,6-diaminopimelate ligase [Bacteroidota bacterium]